MLLVFQSCDRCRASRWILMKYRVLSQWNRASAFSFFFGGVRRKKEHEQTLPRPVFKRCVLGHVWVTFASMLLRLNIEATWPHSSSSANYKAESDPGLKRNSHHTHRCTCNQRNQFFFKFKIPAVLAVISPYVHGHYFFSSIKSKEKEKNFRCWTLFS